jgi:hypothetical protein
MATIASIAKPPLIYKDISHARFEHPMTDAARAGRDAAPVVLEKLGPFSTRLFPPPSRCPPDNSTSRANSASTQNLESVVNDAFGIERQRSIWSARRRRSGSNAGQSVRATCPNRPRAAPPTRRPRQRGGRGVRARHAYTQPWGGIYESIQPNTDNRRPASQCSN